MIALTRFHNLAGWPVIRLDWRGRREAARAVERALKRRKDSDRYE